MMQQYLESLGATDDEIILEFQELTGDPTPINLDDSPEGQRRRRRVFDAVQTRRSGSVLLDIKPLGRFGDDDPETHESLRGGPLAQE